jgi:hypothetical protein
MRIFFIYNCKKEGFPDARNLQMYVLFSVYSVRQVARINLHGSKFRWHVFYTWSMVHTGLSQTRGNKPKRIG